MRKKALWTELAGVMLGASLLSACAELGEDPKGSWIAKATAEPMSSDAGGASRHARRAPVRPPRLPEILHSDRNGNRVDDSVDEVVAELRARLARAKDEERVAVQAELDAPVPVDAVFDRPISEAELETFRAMGGELVDSFEAVSHGFVGVLPRSAFEELAEAMGDSLVLLGTDAEVSLHLDEATRVGRVRPVWRSFAGRASGFSGESDTTIAIVDTGVDGTHTDLAGRMVAYFDTSGDRGSNATDTNGHGTHVAGIALGTGEAFGIGGGTLRYTDSGDLSDVRTPNVYFASPLHLAGSSVELVFDAQWNGGGSVPLYLGSGVDGSATSTFTMVSTGGRSPLSASTTLMPAPGHHYTAILPQSGNLSVGRYAVGVQVKGYAGVGDDFNALRGVAPDVGWAGVKVFRRNGQGSSIALSLALDRLIAERENHRIKIANFSLGLTPGGTQNEVLRARINTVVEHGILVVTSAGNDGPNGAMSDPARAALALTVGASNGRNQVTSYSTLGIERPGAAEDRKPDLVAPGGSRTHAFILAPDSNTSDASSERFPDLVPNDYANMHGTSMAAPFVAGAAALVAEALTGAGHEWDFHSSESPRRVKMLLCASSTETNASREGGEGSPTLGRAIAPKDVHEGYGLVNPDAAIEALLVDLEDTWSSGTSGEPTDRRAWGRRVVLEPGQMRSFTVTMDATADYDLYLYASAPDANGNPVLLVASTHEGHGVAESITVVTDETITAHLFLKRVSGHGSFLMRSDGPNGSTPRVPGAVATIVDGGIADPNAYADLATEDAPPHVQGLACHVHGSTSSSPVALLVVAFVLFALRPRAGGKRWFRTKRPSR